MRKDVNISLAVLGYGRREKDMKTRPCDLCVIGPNGIEGHMALVRRQLEDLPSDPMSPPSLYRCVKCSTTWSRSYVGDGVFLWHAYISSHEDEASRLATGDD
jgi:hypothetical protein